MRCDRWNIKGLVSLTGLLLLTSPLSTKAGEGFVPQPAPAAYTQTNDQGATHSGYVIEGPEYRMTGNPVVDAGTISMMKMRAQTTRLGYTMKARWNAHQSNCNCNQCNCNQCNSNQCNSNQCNSGGCPSCGDGGSNGGWFGLGSGRANVGGWGNQFRRRFGYFYPSRRGGRRTPWIGTYNVVYAVNPGHFDPRDARIYAAEGYGVPLAVPLAPNVRHTYNYGWGIPSSRRTAVSWPSP